jgi:predicted enzyme related to lactoylglutathione lyase
MAGKGSFFWYELMVPDTKAAEAFYSAVVGWSATPFAGGDYTVLSAGDQGVGGIMAAPQGVPPHWIGYIHAADTDAAAAAVEKAGGKIHKAPWDIPTVGRAAAVSDPQGAGYMLMTPSSDAERPKVAPNTPGHIGWHELHTSDWEKAWDFYSGLYGWTKDHAMDMGAMGTYQIFAEDGAQRGAMFNSPGVPHPIWLFYFNVDSIAAAQQRLEKAGGKVMMGPHEVPGGGWIIQATDPQGVMFAIVGPR